MCTVLLPPDVNPFAVNKYIKYQDRNDKYVCMRLCMYECMYVCVCMCVCNEDLKNGVLTTKRKYGVYFGYVRM
jgi:hypothetical protein